MTMTCCRAESNIDEGERLETVPSEISDQQCTNCKGQSRPVSRKTVLLMLKQHLLEEAMTGTYSFCSTRDCPVVYFEERGVHRFTTDDLRVPVGVKTTEDPITLCYCFGFDESHIRDQIFQTGSTNVPQRISALIREGLCACESRNPAGVCCLGEVNRAAKRLNASHR
jgi:Zinc binding domain